MSSVIVKIVYLLMSTFLIVLSAKYKTIKNKKTYIPIFFLSLAFCWGWWGVSTIFHNAEGYPPQWFFYLASTPIFVATALMVFKIKK